MSQPLDTIAIRVAHALRQRNWMLASAESCTGGWIAKVLTDIPGSSAWFERGIVAYSNAAKVELLGVSEAILTDRGAVSREAVRGMVEGILARSNAHVAVAVSGIAGPGGGTRGKPVGTVWFGWGIRSRDVLVRCSTFGGDRANIRRQAVHAALSGVLDVVSDC